MLIIIMLSRLTIDLPESMHTDLKVLASKKRCKMKDIVIELISEKLKEEKCVNDGK